MPRTGMNVRLHEWRQKARLTRAEMAKMINLSKSGIKYKLTCDEERLRRWEAGEVSWPREPYRLALTEVTHLDPEDLGFAPVKRGPAKAEDEQCHIAHLWRILAPTSQRCGTKETLSGSCQHLRTRGHLSCRAALPMGGSSSCLYPAAHSFRAWASASQESCRDAPSHPCGNHAVREHVASRFTSATTCHGHR
jgi:transcriptional regulator with XRE-family HTH domain